MKIDGMWRDQGEMEAHIARMVGILVTKLKMDGITTLGNVDLSGLLYEFLRGGRGRDLRFAEGDLTVLDEFIDLEWPKLMEASKKPPLEPGFTELPPPKPKPAESLFKSIVLSSVGSITLSTSQNAFWRGMGI